MRLLPSVTILMAIGLFAPSAFAQAPVSPQRQLSALVRQDAALRDRIGRIELDALVARVDQTIGHKPSAAIHAARGDTLRRDLDLYTY